MPVRLVPCSRVPRYPLWAVAVVLVWGVLVALGHWLSARSGIVATTCMFKQATGIPCATCGGTRVVVRAAAGQFGWSFATNPLVFVLLALFVLALALRVVFARRIDLGLPPLSLRGRRIAIVAFVALVVANWAYLILRGT